MTGFDEWVAQHNPPGDAEYGRAFWDHVELVRRLVHKFAVERVSVIGEYVVSTPPPEEQLLFPAVALETRRATVALRWDFGALGDWPNEWTVSVSRSTPFEGSFHGLFEEGMDLGHRDFAGFGSSWTFPAFGTSPARFTCQLEDELDVAMLIRLVTR